MLLEESSNEVPKINFKIDQVVEAMPMKKKKYFTAKVHDINEREQTVTICFSTGSKLNKQTNRYEEVFDASSPMTLPVDRIREQKISEKFKEFIKGVGVF